MSNPFRATDNMDDYLSRQLATMSLSKSSHEPERDYSGRPIYAYGIGDARPSPAGPHNMDAPPNKIGFGPAENISCDQRPSPVRDDQRIPTGRDSRTTAWRPYKRDDFVAETRKTTDLSTSSRTSHANPFFYELPSARAVQVGTDPAAMTSYSVTRNSSISSVGGRSGRSLQIFDSVWDDQTQEVVSSPTDSMTAARRWSPAVESTAQQAPHEPSGNPRTSQISTQTLPESYDPLDYRKAVPLDQNLGPRYPSRPGPEPGHFLVPGADTCKIIQGSKAKSGCQTSQVRQVVESQ